VGAHGGVWECPDLFPLKHNNEEVWILLVSINPGGPNGGSATQYFTGRFDGHTFRPLHTDTRWIDFGPDNYAGVTWFGTGDRKVFLGWMSNWQYAQVVPTETWRSAMTLPRDLSLEKIGDKYYLSSLPSKEIDVLDEGEEAMANVDARKLDLTSTTGKMSGPAEIEFTSDDIKDYSITLSNSAGEKTVIGYDKSKNEYYMDRTKSGIVDFEKGFASRSTSRRIPVTGKTDMRLVIDNASVEMFADNGLSVMTAIFFPSSIYTDITIESPDNFKITSLKIKRLKSIF
jgi:fructan beta-fructosidase